jgi:hypothetical protein
MEGGNDQMWITGGYNHGVDLKSTELYDVESKSLKNGPDLPQTMAENCMTKLIETHVFMEGAYGSATSYLVDTGKDPYVYKTLPETSHFSFVDDNINHLFYGFD